MRKQIIRISALSRLIFQDSIRRHALLGLLVLSLAAQASGLLFFDFISRDIGRASSDFIFSMGWISGFIFLFFHAVQVIAWGEEQRTIYSFLARPIARGEYVIGVFCGLASMLLLLNILLGSLGWASLQWIKSIVHQAYFHHFSLAYYILSWIGLFATEVMVLAVILFFSGLVRGSFPVLLICIAYYAICNGLPVVRQAVAQEHVKHLPLNIILQSMGAFFPNFDRLDFKNFIVTTDSHPPYNLLVTDFVVAMTYVVILLWLACAIYRRRDLQ